MLSVKHLKKNFGKNIVLKDISFDEKVVGKAGKLIITFKDNYKIKLDAACNKYFCINEIEE